MKISIGKYDKETKQVHVKFTHGSKTHSRQVNAVLKGNGQYDEDATAERVAEVALGVAHKFASGALKGDEK